MARGCSLVTLTAASCLCVQRELLAVLRSQWHDALLQALQKSKLNMSKLRMTSGYNILYPYLCLLPDEEYVGIMLQVGPCPVLAGPHWSCSGQQKWNMSPKGCPGCWEQALSAPWVEQPEKPLLCPGHGSFLIT